MALEQKINEVLQRVNWLGLKQSLNETGNAVIPALLDDRQCQQLAALYQERALFRTRIVMARHGFGRGEYQYFGYPLPTVLESLRHSFYPHLADLANDWSIKLRSDIRFPSSLEAFLERCHRAGQSRPTPLLLQYQSGDYNCLHQDLYGDHLFPLQLAILLSRPGVDFEGGEFVMTEHAAGHRRAEVVPLRQGDAVIFAVSSRPALGHRGTRKVIMRHGVSRVHWGTRHTAGVIFHDAN